MDVFGLHLRGLDASSSLILLFANNFNHYVKQIGIRRKVTVRGAKPCLLCGEGAHGSSVGGAVTNAVSD